MKCLLYYKQVKKEEPDIDEISADISAGKEEELLKVIDSLKHTTRKAYKFEELGISSSDSNYKKWVKKVIESYPIGNKEIAEYIINDFCSRLRTRQREEIKYALLIGLDSTLILAHSKGEETLTLTRKNTLDIAKRLLDSDNVLRFVIFENLKEGLKVSFREKYKSKSFLNFLGIPEDDIYYEFYGDIIFYLKFGDFLFKYEIGVDDLKTMLEENKLKIRDNTFYLDSTPFTIAKIQARKKVFDTYEKFYEYYMTYLQKLDYYKDKFLELTQGLSSYISRIVDWKDKITVITPVKDGTKEDLILKKDHPLTLLYAYSKNGRSIELSQEFKNYIFQTILSKNNLDICHIGDDFESEPIKIWNLNLFNRCEATEILNLVNDLYGIFKDVSSDKLKYSLILLMCFLSKEVVFKDKYVSFTFDNLYKLAYNNLLSSFDSSDKIVCDESSVLQFKESTFWLSADKATQLIEKIKEEINKKFKNNNYNLQIMFIGIDEQTKNVTPIPNSRLKDEEVAKVRDALKKTYSSSEILRIPTSNNGSVIMLLVRK